MRRIEGSPVGGINESMQKGKYIKGVSILKAPNIALVREADKKGFIQKLPIGQQEVIGRRYPEDGKSGDSLSVIGDDLNLTREGVRQREVRAFKDIQRLKEGKPQTGMGRPLHDIDVSEATRLYTVEGKTGSEIANIMHCSHSTIYDRLRAADVPIRSRGRPRKKKSILTC